MKKQFGWFLVAITSLSLVSAFADEPVTQKVDEEENFDELLENDETTQEQVAAVVIEDEEEEESN